MRQKPFHPDFPVSVWDRPFPLSPSPGSQSSFRLWISLHFRVLHTWAHTALCWSGLSDLHNCSMAYCVGMKLFTCSPLEGPLGRSQLGALRRNICIQVWGLWRVLHSRVQCCVLGYAPLLRKCSKTGCLSAQRTEHAEKSPVSLGEGPACGRASQQGNTAPWG